MSNSLLTGVSGLKVNQEMLDVVGNNLANSNTTGFKSQRINFNDLIYQTLAPASGSSLTSVSGTNPIQVGLGVGVASITTDNQQGALENTGRDLDLAIQGNGYFVAKSANNTLYTRAGAFDIDANNFLVDPSTGYRIERFGTVGEPSATSTGFQVPGNNDIIIPQGQTIPGRATGSTTVQGNLSSSATGPVVQTLTASSAFTTGGAPADATTLLNGLDGNTVDYVSGDSLTLTGSTVAGANVNIAVPVDNFTTVGDLINAINANFPGSTAAIDPTGKITVTSNTAQKTNLNVTIADTGGGTGRTNWATSSLNVSTPGKDGDTVSGSIQIFDQQGAAHALTFTFQKVANNTWDLTASIKAAEGTLTQNTVSGVTFNNDGSFQQVTGGGGNMSIVAQWNGISTPQAIAFDFGASGGFNGLTQVGGNSTAAATAQTGYASGALVNVTISKDGVVTGNFSNGQLLDIAQLAVADFANSGALDRVGNNYYQSNLQSGPAQISTALAGGSGSIEQKVLEQSNVDISLEFTRLITAQRGFQVNAKSITVSDEVLQNLTDIIR